jgi:hypothetical protein
MLPVDGAPDSIWDALRHESFGSSRWVKGDPDASGTLPDALEPGIHCAQAQWIRGFMAFQLARYTGTVLLTVPE